MDMPFCDFIDTGNIFKDKKIYRCSYCGTQLALEDPNIHILCFKKQHDLFSSLHNVSSKEEHKDLNLHAESEEHFRSLVQQQIDKTKINPAKDLPESSPNLCSKEQIDERLKICHSCEHFKDNSCLLCGCVVVRDKNFNNKLAHKEHSCPINKWGPIPEE